MNANVDTKHFLSNNFSMKDSGIVDVTVGIKFLKNYDGFILS